MDDARELRQQGIRAAKAGQKEEARQLLQQSLRLDPDSEPAWLWLASVANNNRERVFCLNKVLEINPANKTAIEALESLNEPPISTAQQPPPTSKGTGGLNSARVTIDQLADQTPGIPVPLPENISKAQSEVDKIVRAYMTPLPKRANWVRKKSGRIGERDIIAFRLQVAAAALVVLVLLIAGFFFAVETNQDVRLIVLGPSATPTPSPTITPTFTPGFSATPSPTPRLTLTPSATVPPNIPTSNPPYMPPPTSMYPQVLLNAVNNSAALIAQGDVPRALATLEREREQNFEGIFDPTIYYYEAIGLARQGSFTTALQTLEEADERIGARTEDIVRYRPYLDDAYAQVYAIQAERALANGNPSGANEAMGLMRVRAEAAIDSDPKLETPYLLLAEDRVRNRRFADAVEILNRGLNVPDLAGNTRLLMAKANIYYEQRNYDAALYQVYLVHYTDPSIEAAYELEWQIGIDRNRPGDASQAAQNYLYYYPGATRAHRLLGEAYELEGKPDLALSIYNRGLCGRTTDPDTVGMLAARAEIYRRLGEADNAIEDFTRLFEITNDPTYRLGRMQTAVEIGRFADALEDAEALGSSPNVPQGLVNLIRGRALVESADSGDRALFQQAEDFLDQAVVSPDLADPSLRGAAYEYLARAQFELDRTEAALESIQTALGIAETGSRRYWRGRINEAENNDAAAALDYEFVLTWSQVYTYPFRVDAEERLNSLRE